MAFKMKGSPMIMGTSAYKKASALKDGEASATHTHPHPEEDKMSEEDIQANIDAAMGAAPAVADEEGQYQGMVTPSKYESAADKEAKRISDLIQASKDKEAEEAEKEAEEAENKRVQQDQNPDAYRLGGEGSSEPKPESEEVKPETVSNPAPEAAISAEKTAEVAANNAANEAAKASNVVSGMHQLPEPKESVEASYNTPREAEHEMKMDEARAAAASGSDDKKSESESKPEPAAKSNSYADAKKKDPKLDSYIKERGKHKAGSDEYEAMQAKINAAYGKVRSQKVKAAQIASDKAASKAAATAPVETVEAKGGSIMDQIARGETPKDAEKIKSKVNVKDYSTEADLRKKQEDKVDAAKKAEADRLALRGKDRRKSKRAAMEDMTPSQKKAARARFKTERKAGRKADKLAKAQETVDSGKGSKGKQRRAQLALDADKHRVSKRAMRSVNKADAENEALLAAADAKVAASKAADKKKTTEAKGIEEIEKAASGFKMQYSKNDFKFFDKNK